MVLPLCTVIEEVAKLEVGRGVAIVELDARVVGPAGGCIVDAGSVLRAREEGRATPELVAFRADVDGKHAVAAGPRGRVAVEIAAASAAVHFVAVLRGDRFLAAPLATDPTVARRTHFRATTKSSWGAARIAGTARWTEVGAPIVATPEPERDHEPATLDVVLDGSTAVPVLIVDAGPGLAGDVVVATEPARREGLARGGVEALAILLSDLPLSIATAPEPGIVVARLAEAARVARAASLARDPLFVVIGQRLATSMLRGFTSCERPSSLVVPAGWPPLARDLASTGVLDDAEAGCARVADLLAANHPDVRAAQEASAALGEALRMGAVDLPTIGPLHPTKSRAARRSPISPRAVALTAVLLGAVVAAIALGLFGRERSR